MLQRFTNMSGESLSDDKHSGVCLPNPQHYSHFPSEPAQISCRTHRIALPISCTTSSPVVCLPRKCKHLHPDYSKSCIHSFLGCPAIHRRPEDLRRTRDTPEGIFPYPCCHLIKKKEPRGRLLQQFILLTCYWAFARVQVLLPPFQASLFPSLS